LVLRLKIGFYKIALKKSETSWGLFYVLTFFGFEVGESRSTQSCVNIPQKNDKKLALEIS